MGRLKPREGGLMFKTQIKFIEDRIRHHRWHATNSLKIQQQLGWESSETFHSGMAKTVEWCLRNLDWINNCLLYTSPSPRDS
mgnify:CR=1 FL=1